MQKLEETLLLQSEEIFEKALFYSNGDPASAFERVFLTTLWIMRKYKGLANKDRALDLFYERLTSQSVKKSERAGDVKTAISEAFALYRRNRKRKSILSLCLLTVVLLAAIYPIARYCIVPALNSDENPSYTTQTDAEGNIIQPVIGSVTMKKTDTIKGDNGKITLENYHNLSGLLKEKSKISALHDNQNLVERFCDSVIAPDGTAYMVYNSIKTEDESNTVVTLYRMEESGWKPLGTGEAQSNYNSREGTYLPSRVYVTADGESNIYVFTLLDKRVTVYRYDCKTGDFTKSASSLPCIKPLATVSFSVYCDVSSGDERIYVGYKNPWRFSFAYYDIQKDEFVQIAEEIGNSMDDSMIFCVENEIIHVVIQGIVSGKTILNYYRIESNGTITKKGIFASEFSWDTDTEHIYNRGSGAGGICVDGKGTVHILATHWEKDENWKINTYLAHYTVDKNLDIVKKELPQHYYADSSYHSICNGFFVGENGEIYYIEGYNEAENLITVCRLDTSSCGSSTLVDVIELTDNIKGMLRIKENSVVFYSDSEHVLYFEFHINHK